MNAKLKSTVLAAGALLAIAPAADAATTFGSRLNHNPANSGDCTQGDLTGPCTIASFIHPSDPNGDPYSGGAPVDGVITKFRTRIFGEGGAAATITLKLAEVSRPNANSDDTAVARLVGTGPTVTVPATVDMQETPIREFAAQLPVKKGQHLALEGTNLWATYNTSGDQFSYVYSPPLLAGPARTSDIGTGELLVQAVIEPDADGDGLGDETQDKNVVPITLRLQKGKQGRRVGGKCVSVTRKNRSKKHCVRYVTLKGSEQGSADGVPARIQQSKSFAGKKLSAGRYRLVAKSAAGTRKVRFRIAG